VVGHVDPAPVRDLCLPVLVEVTVGYPALSGHVIRSTSRKVTTAIPSPVSMFIPAQIVQQILQVHFVEMVKLTEENLRLELRSSSEDEEALPNLTKCLKEVPKFVVWVRAFSIYAWVVI